MGNERDGEAWLPNSARPYIFFFLQGFLLMFHGGNDKAVSTPSPWSVGPGGRGKSLFPFETRKTFVAFILRSEASAPRMPAPGGLQARPQGPVLPQPSGGSPLPLADLPVVTITSQQGPGHLQQSQHLFKQELPTSSPPLPPSPTAPIGKASDGTFLLFPFPGGDGAGQWLGREELQGNWDLISQFLQLTHLLGCARALRQHAEPFSCDMQTRTSSVWGPVP